MTAQQNDIFNPGGSTAGTPVDPSSPSGVLVDLASEVAGILSASMIDPAMATDAEVAAALLGKEDIANKGAANGYAPLDGSGLVPVANLPGGLPPGPHDFAGAQHNASTLAAVNTKISDATVDDLNAKRDPKVHSFAGADHGASTLAEVNSKVSDATLDDASSPRTPTSHAASHENGGADEINVGGLSGLLADGQTPLNHAATHQHGGADEIATPTPAANGIPKAQVGGTLAPGWLDDATETVKGTLEVATQVETNSGLADDKIVTPAKLANTSLTFDPKAHPLAGAEHTPSTLAQLNTKVSDATLDDASSPRTPTAHAAAHQHGGADEIANATPGPNVIPKAGATGELAAGFVSEGAVTQHEGAIDHDALANYQAGQHREINDAGTATTDLWSANKIAAEIAALASGVDLKEGVQTTTFGLGNLTLSGLSTINGVALTAGQRVLVVEQLAPAENGIYEAAAGAWTRASDADDAAEVTNGNVTHVVNPASTDFKSKYLLVTPDPITPGSTGQSWERHQDIDFGTTAGTATEGNDPRVPTQDENDALAGTNGSPSAANPYVTDSDPRNTNARTPTSHAAAHQHGGSDEIAVASAAANAIPKAQGDATLEDAWVAQATESRRGTLEVATQAEVNAGTADDKIVTPAKLAASTVPQTPTAHPLAGAQHTASTLAELNSKVSDATLDDASSPRTPTSHAAAHQHGGSDEIAVAAAAANAIPKAGAGGELAPAWLPQATEAAKGALEVATQAEVDAQTDDTRAVTPLKLAASLGRILTIGFDQQVNDASTTSSTFVPLTSLQIANFQKKKANSILLYFCSMTVSITANQGHAQAQLRRGGSAIGKAWAIMHRGVSSGVPANGMYVFAEQGVAAGTFAVDVQWRRNSGTLQLRAASQDDENGSLLVIEVEPEQSFFS